LQQALKTTIAGFKVPKHVCLAPALPRNAMGKVEKNRLRVEFSRLFEG
jgi:malonyl-CoA/methylmalonyl-CoA synthetase